MTPRDVVDLATQSGVALSANRGKVKITALLVEQVPEAVVSLCREHKPGLLQLLEYESRADELLLESTRTLAVSWPAGCPLDGPEWEAHEAAIHATYWSGDLTRLRAVLAAREVFAHQVFDRYRNEVRHV